MCTRTRWRWCCSRTRPWPRRPCSGCRTRTPGRPSRRTWSLAPASPWRSCSPTANGTWPASSARRRSSSCRRCRTRRPARYARGSFVAEPRITLVTRSGCHLCDVAKETLERIGEPWTEVVLDGDLELEREYGDRVPVVLLDGKEHGY